MGTINERKIIFMIEKIIYVAFDGTEFRDEEECDKYESIFLKNSTIECWDYRGLKISNLSKDCMSSISVIRLNSEEDKKLFDTLFEGSDISCPEKLNTFYMRNEEYGKFMTSQEYEEYIEASYFIIKELEEEN